MASVTAGAMAVNPDVPWNVFTFVFSSVIGIYTFLTKRQTANSDQVHRLEKEVAVLAERVKNLPSAQQVSELDGAMRVLATKVEGATHQLELQQEYLRGGG